LENTGIEIKNICLSVGYKNIQNFYHDFKKRIGLTPRKYRQKTGS
jgi:YesN/AraC family two-component response regulator